MTILARQRYSRTDSAINLAGERRGLLPAPRSRPSISPGCRRGCSCRTPCSIRRASTSSDCTGADSTRSALNPRRTASGPPAEASGPPDPPTTPAPPDPRPDASPGQTTATRAPTHAGPPAPTAADCPGSSGSTPGSGEEAPSGHDIELVFGWIDPVPRVPSAVYLVQTVLLGISPEALGILGRSLDGPTLHIPL